MRRTVRVVLRTRMGIIAVRKPKETQWWFIETDLLPSDQDWKHAAARALLDATCIEALPLTIHPLSSEILHSKDPRKRQHIQYAESRLSDAHVLAELESRGKNGQQVEEVTYWRARHEPCLRKEMRAFLEKKNLLAPPDVRGR